ncbi:hypothetical protein [Tateyamaria sp. ANG-S1]|uniref:hypothetical protein n=1 Tax=Tateyamaria sp. ANG-S1 TaxID=1577905 RepID=UPI00057F0EBD|nr:hypothetical protein [Tateyamaria sp. ANG-S1]KIC51889.1 hypothetical protein RA29_00910 [Tateyamaria sp. ANG-S1]
MIRLQQIATSLLLALFPTATWAEVCDKARPGWDGQAVGMVGEAVSLFLSPAGIALLLISLIALRFRHQWIGLAAVILWTVFITVVTMADPTGVRPQAMVEGCIGPPTLFIVAVAAICVGIVLYTKPRTGGTDGSES